MSFQALVTYRFGFDVLSPSVSHRCAILLGGRGQGESMYPMLIMVTVNGRTLSISQLGAGCKNHEIPESNKSG